MTIFLQRASINRWIGRLLLVCLFCSNLSFLPIKTIRAAKNELASPFTLTGEMLYLGLSKASLSVGGAFVAADGTISGQSENPNQAAHLEHQNLSVNYTSLSPLDHSSFLLNYATPTDYGTLSFLYYQLTPTTTTVKPTLTNKKNSTGIQNPSLNEFSSIQIVIARALSPNFSLGFKLTGDIYRATWKNKQAYNIYGDINATYKWFNLFSSGIPQWNIGWQVRNIGVPSAVEVVINPTNSTNSIKKYTRLPETRVGTYIVPLRWYVGGHQKMQFGVYADGAIILNTPYYFSVHTGIAWEYQTKWFFIDTLKLNGGYFISPYIQGNGLITSFAPYTVGGTLVLQLYNTPINIDYTITSSRNFQKIYQQFSLQIGFGEISTSRVEVEKYFD